MNATGWRQALYGRSLRTSLLRGGLMAVALLLGSQYILSPVRAIGISMQPAVHDGDWLWLWRPAAWSGHPERGQVVGVALASGQAILVKRVVGLPGERVSIAAGVVFVNDVPLDEPYVTQRRPWQVDEVTLSTDEIYVIGDNRGMPARSHDFGRASLARVAGRILGL